MVCIASRQMRSGAGRGRARAVRYLRVMSFIALGVLISWLWPPRSFAGAARIVSLSPSVTETLFALGAGPQVVGVSQYCDYPPAARELPRVGSYLEPNIEAIIGLRPTLIIGAWTSSDLPAFESLTTMGYTTLIVKDNSLDQIEQSIWQIGQRTGHAEAARGLITKITTHLAEVRQRLEGVKPCRVLMVVGHQPMIAVGRGTFLDELLRIAGGRNIADKAAGDWPHLSIEYIVAMKPEVILDGEMGDDPTVPDRFWSRYSTIPAVRSHRIYGYPEDPTLRPGPRVWQSLDILVARIHPQVPKPAPQSDR